MIWPNAKKDYKTKDYCPAQTEEQFYIQIKNNYYYCIDDMTVSDTHQDNGLMEQAVERGLALQSEVPFMFLDIDLTFVNSRGKTHFVRLPFVHTKHPSHLKQNLQTWLSNQEHIKFYIEENPFIDVMMP